MKSCKARCLKYFVHYSNLLLMLSGFVIIGFGGIWLGINPTETLSHFGVAGTFEVYICTIILGILISIKSFLICCGAVVEHRRMIQAYLHLTGILVVVTLAMSITSLVAISNTEAGVEKIMKIQMEVYDTNAQAKSTWDIVQRQGYCCGIYGPKDWKTERLPDTCYSPHNPTWILENGCLKLRHSAKHAFEVFGITGLSLCVFESVMFVVVIYLMEILKRERALSMYNSMESL